MIVTLLLIICSGLLVITGSSISVLPSSEVWEGDQLVIKCTVESEVGVIWVREPFSDEEEIVVRELIAHDEHVLVEDQRYKVESGTENGAAISILKVGKSIEKEFLQNLTISGIKCIGSRLGHILMYSV